MLTKAERTKKVDRGVEPKGATSLRSLVSCEKNATGFPSHRGATQSAEPGKEPEGRDSQSQVQGPWGSAEGEPRVTAHLERSPAEDEPGQWGQQEVGENARPA